MATPPPPRGSRSWEARATPDLPLDDPTYPQLYRLQDLGFVPVGSLSGMRPLTESQVQSLLLNLGQPASQFLLPPVLRGLWLRPIDRLIGRLPIVYALASRTYFCLAGKEPLPSRSANLSKSFSRVELCAGTRRQLWCACRIPSHGRPLPGTRVVYFGDDQRGTYGRGPTWS